jgi:hypothetical protein
MSNNFTVENCDLNYTNEFLLQDSPLNFKVKRHNLTSEYQDNKWGMQSTKPTPLVGLFKEGKESTFLGAHTERYHVVENNDLFEHVRDAIVSSFDSNDNCYQTDNLLRNVTITDKSSYDGAISMRDMVFNNSKFENVTNNGHTTSNALRIIVLNSFDGKTPVKVYGGNIDFFCLNGMVLGSFDVLSKRHTKNLMLGNMSSSIRNLFLNYARFTVDMKEQSQKTLDGERGRAFIEKCFEGMDRKTSNMLNQYDEECKTRGNNVWALTSAFTAYSSGNSAFFSSKNTANDHQEYTTLRRQNTVQRILNSDGYRELIAA